MAVTVLKPQPHKITTRRILPGFSLTLGYTLLYLCLLVLIPLSTMLFKAGTLGHAKFWAVISDPDVVAAFKLSFGASALAALINVVFGLMVAWTLTRYTFPGRRIIDGLVDMPFALPTAVAGLSLSAVYAPNGWLGRYLEPHGIKVDYAPLGILVALVFIGLPFVVRTVQPVLQDLEVEVEEAAAGLGASRFQTAWRIILPTLSPAVLTGFTLAFARALGEYGSVIFLSSNETGQKIVPMLIMDRLEENEYPETTAIAVVMLLASFLLLLLINLLQWWSRKRLGIT